MSSGVAHLAASAETFSLVQTTNSQATDGLDFRFNSTLITRHILYKHWEQFTVKMLPVNIKTVIRQLITLLRHKHVHKQKKSLSKSHDARMTFQTNV